MTKNDFLNSFMEANPHGCFVNGNIVNGNNYEVENVHLHKEKSITIAPRDAFRMAVTRLIDFELIDERTDFAILYQLELEMHAIGTDCYAKMIKLITTVPAIKKQLIPTFCHFKGLLEQKDVYPNWNFGDLSIGSISHTISIAEAYIREMNKYGYLHPSLKK